MHLLAIVHKFKGPHDSFGFVFKNKMAKLILSLAESFDCSAEKSVNLAWEYAKIAWKSYRQPSPPSDPRLRRECTIDHVTVLFIAYSKTEWKKFKKTMESTAIVFCWRTVQLNQRILKSKAQT